ncbi:putative TPR-repeat-containing chaperone protein DNAJ [Trypanosoma grayi]|uniref:putative TPR-repeat-containing chaperone protein DNAJ n=1 Tax=Trypanosoma grayi TaxID=71804 RepID=UPI0004F47C36|nr:putative TPR-repeat-containing chaperone protein DNAJ [Trypanosoma grayi]KEG07512.1 putative TPR-repeat-containing chaperone protein DNAJ [Trypanosoma grayi]
MAQQQQQQQQQEEQKLEGLGMSGRASRCARADDAVLVSTLGCVAGALMAKGSWESALRVIPLGVTELPPLLRLARLRALHCSGDFGEHAAMLLESETESSGRGRRRHGRHKMPEGVRRLVKKMQADKAFHWWDGRS